MSLNLSLKAHSKSTDNVLFLFTSVVGVFYEGLLTFVSNRCFAILVQVLWKVVIADRSM